MLSNAFHFKQGLLQTIDVINYISYVDSEAEIQHTTSYIEIQKATSKRIKVHERPLQIFNVRFIIV